MSNITVYLVVEGRTERDFIKRVLAPKMEKSNISLKAALIGRGSHKGGNVHFQRAKNDIGFFLRQQSDIFVSTMLDYFKIDVSWPGNAEIIKKNNAGQTLSSLQKAQLIEDETHKKIVEAFPNSNPEKRFIPYVSMHEFEALLFSDAYVLSEIMKVKPTDIEKILKNYDNPEEINHGVETAPSKRLLKLNEDYKKVTMGTQISEAIGIDKIRAQCPNFNRWLKRIEALAGQTP
jgi:hypothetical protein